VTERAQTPPPPRRAALRTRRYFQSRRQTPALRSARPTTMFFARRPAWPVRTARPVALNRAARYSVPVSVLRAIRTSAYEYAVTRDAIPRRPCSQAPWCARPARERRRRAAIVRKTPPSLGFRAGNPTPSGRPSCANPHPVALLALVLEVGGLALAAAYPHRRWPRADKT